MKKFSFSLLPILIIIINSIYLIVCFESRVSIGNRIEGDKFIAGDKLHSKMKSPYPTNLTINFQYPIDNLVTSIVLSSENNALIEFDVKYDGILYGKAIAINATNFELTVAIYGFEKGNIPDNFESILDGGKTFKGLLDDYMNNNNNNDIIDENYDDFIYIDNPEDTIMELGERQSDDILLYEKWEHSQETKNVDKHFIIFYFVDNFYLTYTKFIAIKTKTATVTYSNVSDRTMKAIITDTNVISLNVHILIYGYRNDKKPNNHRSLIANIIDNENVNDGIQCSTIDSASLHFPNASIRNCLDNLVIISVILLTSIKFLYS